MVELTQDYLQSILHYDKESGLFTWIINKPGVKFGKKAGTNSHGYNQININSTLYLGHRLAWLYCYGYMPTFHIDHINGDRSDNRLVNLREATPTQNQQNRKFAEKGNSSGLLGVHFNKARNRYIAKISINGKIKYIGQFSDAESAHDAYLKVKREFHEFCTI